jgi:small GTP-binding protein
MDDGTTVRLRLWDTAGQERYSALTGSYMRNASAVLYVYDADSHRSVEMIHQWVQKCEQTNGQAPVRFLIGCRMDLDTKERTERLADDYARRLRMTRHCRCSSKTGQGIEDTFRTLAERLRLVAVEQALAERLRRSEQVDLTAMSRTTTMYLRNACQC